TWRCSTRHRRQGVRRCPRGRQMGRRRPDAVGLRRRLRAGRSRAGWSRGAPLGGSGGRMAKQQVRGLYDPRFEHDSCGFGLIAQIDSRPSRWLVETAVSALARLNHRGAVAADGITGDGCGLLVHRPEAYLRAVAEKSKWRLGSVFTAGNFFLPHDEQRALHCRRVLEEELNRVEVRVVGWRALPTRPEVCGETARATLPAVAQLFVSGGASMDTPAFDRALFLARRRAERRLTDEADFYVLSLSAYTLSFKGMVMPEHLPDFYPDLAREDLASCAVLFHQRFSTNTAPQWKLAQPFRLLAHNGEINTIQGNRNWMRARGAKWRSPLVDLRDIDPLVALEGSDSQSLDNALEVMLAG